MTEKFYLPWENTVNDSFKKDAACRGADPELFMPAVGTTGKEAKEICNGKPATYSHPGTMPCPVRDECLAYSLQIPGPVYGIWGGKSERERRVIRREQLTVDSQQAIRVSVKRPVEHGTASGYEQHRRRRETPCRSCKEAHSKASQAWRDRRNDRVIVPALQALVELVHAENARSPRTTEGS